MDSIWFSSLIKICSKMVFLIVPKEFSPGGKLLNFLLKKLNELDHLPNAILMQCKSRGTTINNICKIHNRTKNILGDLQNLPFG